jgi:hypothetical protein
MIKYFLNKAYTPREKMYAMGMQKFLEYVEFLESQTLMFQQEVMLANQDWDNDTLVREWEISYRTAYRYRQNGLEYFKQLGKIYYTPEARRTFTEKLKNK